LGRNQSLTFGFVGSGSRKLLTQLFWASSDFDIRHNFQAALTYDVPGNYTNGFPSTANVAINIIEVVRAQNEQPSHVQMSMGSRRS
jgi:hypothetical protein